MKFTDKQLMLYVDGGLDKKTIKKIETALKKDKSLMERISVFQIANDAMLQHADETMKMPAELFEQLLEIEGQPEKAATKAPIRKGEKSLLSRFIDDLLNFNPIPAGFATAAVVALGFFTTSQIQIANNENLARDFFASMEKSDRYSSTMIDQRKSIIIANVQDHISKVGTRSSGTEEKLPDIETNENDNLILDVVDQFQNKTCSIPDGTSLTIGSKIGITFKAPTDGLITLYYFDVNKKKYSLFRKTKIDIEKNEKISKSETVEKPVGQEYLQYIFEKDGNDPLLSGILKFRTIDKNNNFYVETKANPFENKPRSLFSKETTIKLNDTVIDSKTFLITDFGKDLLNSVDKSLIPSIWKSDNSINIDFTGDRIANVVSIPSSTEDKPGYLIVDRNGNQKMDAVIKLYKNGNGTLFYQWLLDEDEDGKPEILANDCDGNWTIDQKFSL